MTDTHLAFCLSLPMTPIRFPQADLVLTSSFSEWWLAAHKRIP